MTVIRVALQSILHHSILSCRQKVEQLQIRARTQHLLFPLPEKTHFVADLAERRNTFFWANSSDVTAKSAAKFSQTQIARCHLTHKCLHTLWKYFPCRALSADGGLSAWINCDTRLNCLKCFPATSIIASLRKYKCWCNWFRHLSTWHHSAFFISSNVLSAWVRRSWLRLRASLRVFGF